MFAFRRTTTAEYEYCLAEICPASCRQARIQGGGPGEPWPPPEILRSRFAHKGDPYDFGGILRFGGLGPPPSSKIGPWPPPVVESCIRACP